MGFGSILKKVAKVAIPAAIGFATGGPAGAAMGGLQGLTSASGGGGVGNILSAFQGAPSSRGTAADPNMYTGIRLPGVTYPEGMNLVDYPDYPDMPQYGMAPGLPNNIPIQPVSMLPASEGERKGMNAADLAAHAYGQAVNPLDPRVLQLGKAQSQLAKNAQLRGIADLTRANRRETAMGRQGIFSGERGSENIARIIAQNAQDADLAGNIQARSDLNTYGTNMRGVAGSYQNQATLEQQRRADMLKQLMTAVEQIRSDVGTRTDQGREDYVNRLNIKRSDIANKYQGNVNRISAALNQQNNTNPTLAQATALNRANRQDYNTQRGNTAGDAISNILGMFSGGGGSASGALPWHEQLPWLSASGAGGY